jgi:hypothetical protein
LSDAADDTRKAWDKLLVEEAEADADVLLTTLEPYQPEIEHHFSVQGQSRFTGPMRWYLKAYNGVQYAGSSLRDRIPLLPKMSQKVESPKSWNVGEFTRECSRVAGEKALDKRLTALSNRLLVEAEQRRFPISYLTDPCESAAKLDWRNRFDLALSDALRAAEQVWVKPTGTRKWIQFGLVTLANTLPMAAFVIALLILLYRVYMNAYLPTMFDFVVPFLLTLIVLVILQILISLLLPMRWSTIRGEFRRQLEERLVASMRDAFLSIPTDVAAALQRERKQIEDLRREVAEVERWLSERQQTANIAGLYGSTES